MKTKKNERLNNTINDLKKKRVTGNDIVDYMRQYILETDVDKYMDRSILLFMCSKCQIWVLLKLLEQPKGEYNVLE